ncbi:TetR/AcrR family transcriptional regulator [Croceicoccus ponticola]|uniref:TetR/AcrR family transcriptional regulator n=1 Tax=Croceicoccus ponticola TaxID=2217664 RepID=A0A437GWQ5_9SPHN|nr:TetR/AcrR family transcriptional regulator [Croceicoccus ponticola]RVQ66548.1 TetR/AcrR family transcriptional regulator [Croceicoccus ponticola]
MTARHSEILRKIRPGGGPEDFDRWQQRKGLLTREAMLDASVDCLVESGYAGLSTNDVARRAGVSRGAMHHHFATRIALVEGLIEHIFYRRMRQFLDDFAQALEECGKRGFNVLPHVLAVELHWQTMQTKDYEAYLRLAVAARNDDDLARVFQPAAKRFDEVWMDEMAHAFPQWHHARQLMTLASDMTQAVHIGLLVNGSTMGEARSRLLQEHLAMSVNMLAERAEI